MTKQLMTAEQAFTLAMNTYPSLYHSNSEELSKMKYFDHTFNTAGNGYSSIEKFYKAHLINNSNKELITNYPAKYITGEPLFYAYTKFREHPTLKMPDSDSCLSQIYTKKELTTMPYVVHTISCNEGELYNFCPYPNFCERYSLMWQDIHLLDTSWCEAALFFYKGCKDFFLSDNIHLYHLSCPENDDDEKWEKQIHHYESNFQIFKKDNMSTQDFHTIISQEYEQTYTGDTKQFIKDIWSKELKRIHNFLDNTTLRLQQIIESKQIKENMKNQPQKNRFK